MQKRKRLMLVTVGRINHPIMYNVACKQPSNSLVYSKFSINDKSKKKLYRLLCILHTFMNYLLSFICCLKEQVKPTLLNKKTKWNNLLHK